MEEEIRLLERVIRLLKVWQTRSPTHTDIIERESCLRVYSDIQDTKITKENIRWNNQTKYTATSTTTNMTTANNFQL